MDKNLLPIGSIILLDGASKKLMITGFHVIDTINKKEYDYCGCLYPEGFMEKIAVFNHSQIKEVLFKGMMDREYFEFKDKFNSIYQSKKKETSDS